MKNIIIALGSLLLFIESASCSRRALTACSTTPGSPSDCNTHEASLPPPAPQSTLSCSLVANPASISAGGTSMLTLTVPNGETVQATINGGAVQVDSPIPITLSTSQTYVATVMDSNGSSSKCEASVAVVPASLPPPPTCTIVANPTEIKAGESSQITMTISGATQALLNGTDSEPPAGGTITVQPPQSKNYVLMVGGPGGNAQCQTSVTVDANPPPPQLAAQLVSSAPQVNIQMNLQGQPAAPSSPFKISANANEPGAVLSNIVSTPPGIVCDQNDNCTLPSPGIYSINGTVTLNGQVGVVTPVQVTAVAVEPPDPCRGLAGTYTGLCTSQAPETNNIAVTVSAQNGQCIASFAGAGGPYSSYYSCVNTVTLSIALGVGSASLSTQPNCGYEIGGGTLTVMTGLKFTFTTVGGVGTSCSH